ncbi:hypothetical protein BJ741DRAFT_619354 [Chytriomyces cf. hyalinus JEL632]|nr:hypothetical protein BJ741DRAFT_619354 [Chytriomyces cf. hyalinus JEL632]
MLCTETGIGGVLRSKRIRLHYTIPIIGTEADCRSEANARAQGQGAELAQGHGGCVEAARAGQAGKALIQWRVLGGQRAVSLSVLDGPSPCDLVLLFPVPLLPTPRLLQDADTLLLHLMAVTVTGVFVRIQLALGENAMWVPRSLHSNDTGAILDSQFLFMHDVQLPAAATVSHFPDLDTALIGVTTGATLVLETPRPSDPAYRLQVIYPPRPTSITSTFKNLVASVATPMKFLSSWSGTGTNTGLPSNALQLNSSPYQQAAAQDLSNPAATPVSIASVAHASSIFCFALCRDHKLRIYNATTCSHIKTFNLQKFLASATSSGYPGSHHEDTASVTGASSISGVANGMSNMAFSSSQASSSPGGTQLSEHGEQLLSWNPSANMASGLANRVKVFAFRSVDARGIPIDMDVGDAGLSFKVAVYVEAMASGDGGAEDSSAFDAPNLQQQQQHQHKNGAGGFVFFEAEVDAGGAWRQIHYIGNSSIDSTLERNDVQVKDFAFAEVSRFATQNAAAADDIMVEDEDEDMQGVLDKELFQVWVLSAPIAKRGLFTGNNPDALAKSAVHWADFEISAVEDRNGLRIRGRGNGFSQSLQWNKTAANSFSDEAKIDGLDYECTMRSVEDVFADYILQVERFSSHTIFQALELYVDRFAALDAYIDPVKDLHDLAMISAEANIKDTTPIPKSVSAEGAVLREIMFKTIGTYSLDLSNSDLNVAKDVLQKEWESLLQVCFRLRSVENEPLGLYVEDCGLSTAGTESHSMPRSFVIRRGRVGAVRPCDSAEMVTSLQRLRVQPLSAINLFNESITSSVMNESFLAELSLLFKIVDKCKHALGLDAVSEILNEVRLALKRGLPGTADMAIKTIIPQKLFQPLLGGGAAAASFLEFVKLVKSFSNFGALIEGCLRVTSLKSASGLSRDFIVDTDASFEVSSLVASLTSESFAEIATARNRFISDLLLVIVAVLKTSQGAGGDKSLAGLIPRRLVARVLGAYQSCELASFVANTHVTVNRKLAAERDMMDLDIVNQDEIHIVPLSLLLSQSLFKSGKAVVSKSVTVEERSAFLVDSAIEVFAGLGLFDSDTDKDPLSLSDGLMMCAWHLASSGFADAAWGLIERLPHDTFHTQYLKGFVKMKASSYELAQKAFEKAAGAFGRSNVAGRREFSLLLDESVLSGGVLAYYQHVSALFADVQAHKMVTVFAKLALESMTKKEKSDNMDLCKSLWSTMFNHALEAKEFEKAFSFLMENSDMEFRKYSMRAFITSLCKSHQIAALCSYNFAGLQFEVEESLLFSAKARSVVPIPARGPSSEPNYHRILYSYYTSRDDNRNAAKIMFEYARRLNSVGSLDIGGGSLSEVLTEQAYAYLAAINSLELVHENNRYLLHREKEERSLRYNENKNQYVAASFLESDYGSTDSTTNHQNAKLAVVSLKDIRKEYQLTLAKLNLAKDYHELDVSPGLPDVEMAITLLTHEAKFDFAIKLAKVFDKHPDEIFGEFAARCVMLTESDLVGAPTYHAPLIDEQPVGLEGSSSEKAWGALRVRLDERANESRVTEYRKAAIDNALLKNPEIELPLWLTKSLKESKPEELVRIYLRHGLVQKAAVVAVDYVKERYTAGPQNDNGIQPTHCSKWLSAGAIDQVLLALESEIANENESKDDIDETSTSDLEKLQHELASTLYHYISMVRDETLMLAPDTNMDSVPQPEDINCSLRYGAQLGDTVEPARKSNILSRLGPATASTKDPSILARLGPAGSAISGGAQAEENSFGASRGASAFSFGAASMTTATSSVFGATSANAKNVAGTGGGFFGDLTGSSNMTPSKAGGFRFR